MPNDLQPEMVRQIASELSKISAFSDLSEDQLKWLAERFEEVRFEQGAVFARQGDPVNYLLVLLEGELRWQLSNTTDRPSFAAQAGQVTGLLPYSRLTRAPGTGRAILPTRALQLHKDFFPEMLRRMPELGQRLVALMSDRIREVARVETQHDKLMALGKLSAGLAHELNNPASAARRAASSLAEALEAVREASLKLLRDPLTQEQLQAIALFEKEAAHRLPVTSSDPLEVSDREQRLTEWLEARSVPEAWKISPTLAESCIEPAELDTLVAKIGDSLVGPALARVARILVIYGLVREIDNSTRRISELVRAVKAYSYKDKTPVQEVDVHRDLENTLLIFGHRLKGGVKVVREYASDLPRVYAHGGELNQVWTNLIDNALDAMRESGELRIRTGSEPGGILVEIGDSGPGIPPDVQPLIFDPFFSTKEVGEGVGLGLDTACRIIRNHHGTIRVESKPGDTRFQVRLPLTQPQASQ